MNPWTELGKVLIVLGIFICLVGVLLVFMSRLPFNPGRLPGDILFRQGGLKVYFPWVTCLVISVILSLFFSLFNR